MQKVRPNGSVDQNLLQLRMIGRGLRELSIEHRRTEIEPFSSQMYRSGLWGDKVHGHRMHATRNPSVLGN
jgi:hypothetical protein